MYIGESSQAQVPADIDGYSVTGILDYAFYMDPIVESVVISNGIEYVGSYAFSECPNLTKVQFPRSVTEIGENVFSGSENVTAYVKVNSTAHTYMKGKKIPYKIY